MPQDDPIANLARQIDAAKRTEHFAVDADHVAALRRRGACELHSICAELVSSVNSRLSQTALDLSPSTHAPEIFRESGGNVCRIVFHRRDTQLTFSATLYLL